MSTDVRPQLLPPKIRAGNPESVRYATAGSLRSNVVEDPVKSEAHLIHRIRRKKVGLRDGRIAGVVDDALVAGKGALFGESGRSARHIRLGLIIAEASEQSVFGRNVFIHPNVELAFVERPHGLTGVVVVKRRVIGIRQRIQINQFLANPVETAGRDDVGPEGLRVGKCSCSGWPKALSVKFPSRMAAVGTRPVNGIPWR